MLFAYRDVTITVWHATADDVAVNIMDQVSGTRISRFPNGVSGVQTLSTKRNPAFRKTKAREE